MALADLKPGEHATSVRNHWWWRPGWRVGRRFYAFHVTFEGQRALYDQVAAYRDVLATLQTVTLVPNEWLHLTMQGVGFTDEVERSVVDRIAIEAGTLLESLGPFVVQFGEITVADEAIAMSATPESPVRQLRNAVREAIGRVLGHAHVPEDPNRFRPHVSVAYIAAEGPADPYVAAVREVDRNPVDISINNVSLIEMHRDNCMYEWATLATFPLRGNHGARTAGHSH